jgi:hypothetical protein
MTQRQNIFGFILLSAIFVGWLVYSESKSSDSEKNTAANGPKDSDGDGVLDEKDQCPNEAGEINLFGCPDGDTDGDGLDEQMEAKKGTDPNKKDSDGDGVDDNADVCPNKKGTKENNGCVKKETVPEPEPVINFDEYKTIEMSYKGVKYTIKQGFTTEKGMAFNKMKWRFFSGKWSKQELDNPNGAWTDAKNDDINLVLARNAKKVKKSGENGGDSRTGGGGGSTSGDGSTSGGSTTGEKASIPNLNKNLLKVKYQEIMSDGDVSYSEKNSWTTLYKTKYKNGNYTEDAQIEAWNDDMNQ